MSKLRIAVLTALLALLLAGWGTIGGSDVVAAGHHSHHSKTHPTAAHVSRRAHHHGSGNKAHQHHARHARHARTHGQRKHAHAHTKHTR
jgi:hypothetical protein